MIKRKTEKPLLLHKITVCFVFFLGFLSCLQTAEKVLNQRCRSSKKSHFGWTVHKCVHGQWIVCVCVWFCSSHLQFLLQFSSVIPSSSSPQMSTAEKINATSTAKQHTKAKITMHFCWDCKREKERNIDFQGVFSSLQNYSKNKAKVPQPWLPLADCSSWHVCWFNAHLSRS